MRLRGHTLDNFFSTPDTSPVSLAPNTQPSIIINISPSTSNSSTDTAEDRSTDNIQYDIAHIQNDRTVFDVSSNAGFLSMANYLEMNRASDRTVSNPNFLSIRIPPDGESNRGMNMVAVESEDDLDSECSNGWTNLHTPVTPEMMIFPDIGVNEKKIHVIDLPER